MAGTKDIWHIGNIPIHHRLTLAPMAGFTDSPFRKLCHHCGVGYTTTELISCKGLVYNNQQTKKMLFVDEDEGIVALQLFGSNPDDFAYCINSEWTSRFDIIDINMGCPAKKITRNKEGSALMLDLSQAAKIIETCAKNTQKPVTVKFRLGYHQDDFVAIQFAQMCKDSGASAVTIHGRYAMQLYRGQADWEKIGQVAAKVNLPIIGNGDIVDPNIAKEYIAKYSVVAIAIGRGALGNPQIFAKDYHPNTPKKQYAICQLDAMCNLYGDRAAIIFRSHIGYYLKGIQDSKYYKDKIIKAASIQQIKDILSKIDF